MRLSAFLLMAAARGAYAQATPADFRLLGSLPAPFVFSGANAVSGDGAIVAGICQTTSGSLDTRSFRWTQVDGMTLLYPPPPFWGYQFSPSALNGDGSVVVGTESGSRVAWRWSLPGGFTRLSLLPTSYDCNAQAITPNARFIVGGCATNTPPTGGYLYDTINGTTLALAQVPGTPSGAATATGISFDGSIILCGSQVCNMSANTRTTIAAPTGTTVYSAVATDYSGTRWAGTASTVNGTRPARWTSGVGTILNLPPLGLSGNGLCISGEGSIIGGTYLRSLPALAFNPPQRRALIWRADLGCVDLTDYAGSVLVLNLAGTVLEYCNGISADGKVLVGSGVAPTGGMVAWMLRLPGALRLCPGDLGSQGGIVGPDGVLDNNDFIIFIASFFTGNARADVGKTGGLRGSDGTLDNNDFVVFIDLFFTGCP